MFDEMEQKLTKVVEHVKQDLNGIKTGRAKPSLVEHVLIEAYPGQKMQLVELASISAPDPHMLVVQPWDQSVIGKIEKGLAIADLHLNPVVDGNIVRINIPPLTEERRKELVKLVGQKLEIGKEMMRGIRNDTKREIDERKGTDGVSEDDIHDWQEEMQSLYDTYVAQLDEMGTAKEKELLEI